MVHWNGNQTCVIDTETTGLIPGWHEIVQICVLPVDSNFEPRKDVNPFYMTLRPLYPERADKKALKVNGLKLHRLMELGFDPEKAVDLLEEWAKRLDLPVTKGGFPKKIIPMGHVVIFDIRFMKEWMGDDRYDEMFDYHYRDTQPVALYFNDRASFHGEKVPYSKTNLRWLAKELNIPYPNAHNALADCLMTAKVYKKMCQMGLLG